MDGLINMLVWAAGGVAGFFGANAIDLPGKLGKFLGSFKSIGLDNKLVAWLLSVAIWAFIAVGGFAGAAKLGGKGMKSYLGHFISGFGVGGLVSEALAYDAVVGG
jgi:hypothetical protein